MKTIYTSISILISLTILTACSGMPTEGFTPLETAPAQVAQFSSFASATAVPTLTVTAAPTPTSDLYAELHVTETALALYRADLDQQAQAMQVTQMAVGVQITSDAATSTAVKAITNEAQIYAINTQTAKTAMVASVTADAATQVSAAATKVAEGVRERSDLLFITGSRIIGLFGLLAIVSLAIYGIYRWIETWQFNNTRIKPNERGQFDVVPEATIPGKNKNLVNPNLAHRVVMGAGLDDLDPAQALTNKNMERAKEVEITKAVPQKSLTVTPITTKDAIQIASGKLSSRDLPKYELPALNGPSDHERLELLALPEWSMLDNWQGNKLPYGTDGRDLLLADPQEDPHMLIVGRTRTGKSRYGLRTLAAAALTKGYQVLFVGKRVDFYPFEGHPNAKIVGVDLLNDPQKYFDVLARVAGLMKQRDDYLTSRRYSVWQQTGLPQLYVVLDEFSSAVKQLNATKPGAGNRVSSIATALIQEGGKYGINIIQVVQDATGANVDISARRNMGRMVFRLSEQKASDVALGVNGDPSAVRLPHRHFLSLIGGENVTRGVAFAPSDDDIVAFLRARPVNAHEPMDWVDGEVVEEQSALTSVGGVLNVDTSIAPNVAAAFASLGDKKAEQEKKIIDLYLEYLNRKEKPSLAAIEKAVFDGRTGGSFHNTVKRVIAEYEGVDVEKLADVILDHLRHWVATADTTTIEKGGEVPSLDTNSPVVAG